MTVSTTKARQQYSGDGNTTSFSFSFKVLTKDELQVIGVNTTSNALDGIGPGLSYTYVRGTDYGVTLTDPGGSVTFNLAPSTGIRIAIIRQSKQTQDIDYVANDPFPAETHEEGLDRAVLRDQERRAEIERSLRISEADDTAVNLILPVKEDRKDTGLGFDSNGEPVPFSGFVDSDQVPVTSFAEQLLDDTTATEARQTLGVAGQADRFAVTTGTQSTLVANPNTPTVLTDGETVFLRFHVNLNSNATLNINSTGDKPILDNQSEPVRAGSIYNGDLAVLMYDSSLSVNGAWVAFGTNPRLFDDRTRGYYTNIPSRLGYTPADVAGSTFSGTVRVNHQVQFQSKDSAGNNRQVAGISNNNIVNLGDVNSPQTNLSASSPDKATVNGDTIWNYGNMPEYSGRIAALSRQGLNPLSGSEDLMYIRFVYRRLDNNTKGAVTVVGSVSSSHATRIEDNTESTSGQVPTLGLDDSDGSVTVDADDGIGNDIGIINNINADIEYAMIVWPAPGNV